jgi:hypothetical protein
MPKQGFVICILKEGKMYYHQEGNKFTSKLDNGTVHSIARALDEIRDISGYVAYLLPIRSE